MALLSACYISRGPRKESPPKAKGLDDAGYFEQRDTPMQAFQSYDAGDRPEEADRSLSETNEVSDAQGERFDDEPASAEAAVPLPTATWLWALRSGGTENDMANALVELIGGQILVSGSFGGTALFEGRDAFGVELEAKGTADAFLATYSIEGVLLAAERFGGTGSNNVTDLARRPDNRLLMTGSFSEGTVFGQGEVDPFVLHIEDTVDAVVANLDSSGRLTSHAVQISGVASERGSAISAVADAFVVMGNFHGTAIFNLGRSDELTFSSDFSRDTFVARYDADAELEWAAQVESTVTDGYGLGVCEDESVWVAGRCSSRTTFDPGLPTEIVLDPESGVWFLDLFVARYTRKGSVMWARQVGSHINDTANTLVVLEDCSAIVVGTVGTAVFGSGEANETRFQADNGLGDPFIAHYDPSGKLIWVHSLGSEGNLDPIAIARLPNGDLLVAGNGHDGVQVSRHGSDGGRIAQLRATCDSICEIRDLIVLPDYRFLIAGWFQDAIHFTVDQSEPTTLSSAGETDIFLAMGQLE